MTHFTPHRHRPLKRLTAGLAATALVLSQLSVPPRAEASHLGSSTASAGSAPPPAATTVQSFQPDLFTGRATTSIPIAVPPGRKGMQPNLALGYSSSGRNGWVGVGWELDLGYIERSTKRGLPTYVDVYDKFAFMFQGVSSDLVRLEDGTYRAKDEGLFLRFDNAGASGWMVRDQSGTRYYFGQTSASQIQQGGQVFRWCLDKIVDRNGNTLTIRYDKDIGVQPGSAQIYPIQIDYTGHEPSGLSPANRVTVELETRPDVETSYRSGFAVTTARRLKAIETSTLVDGQRLMVRRYVFSYSPSRRTGRSLLTQVQIIGADGATTLPPTHFAYQDADTPTAYTLTTQTAAVAKPQLAGDVDGNATSDLIAYDKATGTWSVSCASGCTLGPKGTWLTGFGAADSIPLLGDFNGDGKTDVATFKNEGENVNLNGVWQFATSNGASFVAGTIPPPQPGALGGGTPLVGDFNGDGLTDVGVSTAFTIGDSKWHVALSTRRENSIAFQLDESFNLSWGTRRHTPLTGDFNGDGLTDIAIVDEEAGSIAIGFSTGHGWTGLRTLITGFGRGKPHASADVDGDGLTDLVYYDKTTGQIFYALARPDSSDIGLTFVPSSRPLAVTFSLRSSGDELQMADFNADGLADPAVFNPASANYEIATSQGTAPDLLLSIDNGLGAQTALTYGLSSAQPATALPFVTPVVTQVTVTDGLGHSYASTYRYAGGRYDGPTQEFRGFAKVELRDPDGNVTTTEFHQDDVKKGRPVRTEFRDAAGQLWTKTEQTWGCTDPYAGVACTDTSARSFFVTLDQTDAFSYDATTTPVQTRTRFRYDAYGNVIRTDEDGDVNVTGDERATVTTFAYNPSSAWIFNKPIFTQTLDAAGAVVRQRRFTYDDDPEHQALGSAKGNLTTEEEWLQQPTGATWPATKLTYEDYGNVKTVTDALDRTTTNTYDPTGTYLTQIKNALGHTRQLAYDPRFGQVTRSTDQNGQTTTTEYDALGRVAKVIGPTDTTALPTVEYAYAPGAPISKTVTRTRLASGQADVATVHTFTDGLGRILQTRSPAQEAAQQVVTGVVEFNSRGLVARQWVPYFSKAAASYVPRPDEPQAEQLAAISYAYDPLGRLLTVTDPDGSTTTTAYAGRAVTVTDANGHRIRRTSDAAGRLAKVEEFAEAETYTTTYAYDALNHLTQVTDHAGHVTALTYDTLGRKTAMDDPDMGRWTYAYDAVDNLTTQTDARGVTTTFVYDALNRLSRKSFTVPSGSGIAATGPVAYAYDDPATPFSTGRLTAITDGSGSSSFAYDALGRLITEEKVIDGKRYVVKRVSDLLGRLTALTYPDGQMASYTYTAQGGLAGVDLRTPSGAVSHLVTDMASNAAGQVTRIAYGNGVTTDYSYDPKTFRLSQLMTRNPQLATTLQDFTYQFDAVGNVTHITDRVHTGTQTFEYDPLNRLSRASGSYGDVRYAYDPLGNLKEKEGRRLTYGLADGAKPHALASTTDGWTLSYDANGNLTAKASATPALPSQTCAYDADNRLVAITTTPGAPARQPVTLALKPGWNVITWPAALATPSIASAVGDQLTALPQISRLNPTTHAYEHFVNDPAFDQFDTLEPGRGYWVYATHALTLSLRGDAPSGSLTLPAGPALIGNPTAQPLTVAQLLNNLVFGVDVTGAWRYNGTDFIALSQTDPVAVGEAIMVRVASPQTWRLPADAGGAGGPTTSRFLYDGDGGRVKQLTPVGTTLFLGELYEVAPNGTATTSVFAGGQRLASIETPAKPLASLTATPTRSRLVRWLAHLDTLLAFILEVPTAEAAGLPEGLRFFHGDHLGSINLVTDGMGAVVELTEHAPYGAITRHEGTGRGAHQFTGQRQDETHGLIFFPARPYDPSLGRFLQPDPFVQDPADPQSLNRYSYVRNNPVNFVDPSGYRKKKHHHFWRRLVAAVVAVVVAVVVTIVTENPYAGAAAGFATYYALTGTTGGRSSAAAPQDPTTPRGPPGEAGDLLAVGGAGGGAFAQGAMSIAEGAPAVGAGLAQFEAAAALGLLSFGLAPAAAALVAIEATPAAQEALGAVGIRGADRLLREMARTDSRAGRLLSELLGFRGGFADRFGRIGTTLAGIGLLHDLAGTLQEAALTADQKVLMVNQQFVRAELTTAGGLVGAWFGGEAIAPSLSILYGLAPGVTAGVLAVGMGTLAALGARKFGDFLLEQLRRDMFFDNVRRQASLDRG